jgi:DNA-3-methyladenine glycosylase
MQSVRLGNDLEISFFDRNVVELAERLIGTLFSFEGSGGIIVETEAYRLDDEASHSFRGKTPRNNAMFGIMGTAYLYRSYGIHWCMNIVGRSGSAVLIRALEPTVGIDVMYMRRSISDTKLLCAGPGRLCQALRLDGTLNGQSVTAPPFELRIQDISKKVIKGKRVGISRAQDRIWRFGLSQSPYLSRPFLNPVPSQKRVNRI